MFLRLVALSLLLISFSRAASAQNAPDIALRSDTELGAFQQSGLVVESLSISADIRAGLAQISLLATLWNETEEDIEASFAYPLPANSVINGYALDIDGELVDGVLLPKERAEKLYTDRVTQSIDPGIAARTLDNRYKTRIYPIDANGGRRSIRLDFTAPVPADGLRLPFSFDRPIESVTLQIQGDGADQATRPFEATTTRNTVIIGDVFIPAAPAAAAISTYHDNKFVTVPLASNAPAEQTDVKSVAVIWDNSLSRQASDLNQERRFLWELLSELAPDTQSLVIGANQVLSAARYESAETLLSDLKDLRYDGATNLYALLDIKTLQRSDVRAEVCLVITDGLSSFGRSGTPNLPCRVFTYSAAKTANTDWLSLLAARNAGVNLSGQSAIDAVRHITTKTAFQLAPEQVGEIFHFGNRSWFIAPIEDNQRNLKIKFQDSEKNIPLNTVSSAPHQAAAAIWGQRQIELLRADGSRRFDEIVAASRRWSVQSPETSFLVLESADEYVEAELSPPRNFPADSLEEYKTALAEHREEKAEDREAHFEEIAELWEEQVDWWETDWSEAEDETGEAPVPAPPGNPLPQAVAPPPPAVQSSSQPIPLSEPNDGFYDERTRTSEDCEDCDYVIVTGARRINPAGSLPAQITLNIRAWAPERPFLNALDGLTDEAFEVEYIRQRKTHGDRPSFYLEIADQLHRAGRAERAAEMALSALELPSLTHITKSNAADRLLMYGETDIAIEIYRDVLPAAKDRPQPFYNLALALIQAGDRAKRKDRTELYGEAFTHLVHVINNPWEDEYEGIHLIALQDLNRTLARLPRRLRRKFQRELGLDKMFYRNLHTDIRVLVDWTAADADLDIHVIEGAQPVYDEDEDAYEEEEIEAEETAYFGNQQTRRGGRVSNDMTEGYGPEEYLIRKAPNGLYRIESDYYAQDEYTEDGALNLRARIWRNFGRKNESFETVIIEMLEEKEDPYVLGEIQVGPKN